MAERTANERIQDAFIRHQVRLQQLSAGLSKELVDLLDVTERSVRREIEQAIAKGAGISSSASLRRLQFLEDSIGKIRGAAMGDLAGMLTDQMEQLVRHEAEFTSITLDVESPTELNTTIPSEVTLVSLVADEPFEGQLLKEWMDRLSAGDARRIKDSVRVGMTRGLPIDDIVRMALGSAEFDGADGATAMTRNQVNSLVRTAVNAFSNMARDRTYQENSDLIDFEMYHATLDSRTTPICRSLDGKVYPRGEGKFPPQHFGCRSIRVAVLSGVAAGLRPLKGSSERQIAREFGEKRGFSALTREDVPRGMKGEFDKFARQRVRELTGSAPASTTYSAFLSRQSRDFQEEVLGVTKARLFREGGLTDLGKYVTRSGQELTLSQLAQKERAAFVRAGLDPKRFQ